MAAPTTVLTIVKRFLYRGQNEEWSNQYMLTGATPADSAAWRTLFDALVLQEKTCYSNLSSVVAGYGYNQPWVKGVSAVWSVDMTVAPNAPVAGVLANDGRRVAGDQAGWVRWGLDRLNSKGKQVFLRKYFHDGIVNTSDADACSAGYQAALGAFGAKMWDGSFAGGRKVTDHLGSNVLGRGNSTYITTRTLKRRGKRPPVV